MVNNGNRSESLTTYVAHPHLAAAAEHNEALLKGYTHKSVVVMTGAGGIGKTHVKEAIGNNPPLSFREKISLSKDPIISIILASDSHRRVMDNDLQASMLASAMVSMVALKRKKSLTLLLSNFASTPPNKDASLTVTSSSDAMPHPVENDFLDLIDRVQDTDEEPCNHDLVYLFDTGGQPAFHAILPSFLPSLFPLMLKLLGRLNHHPKVHFFVHGKPVGAPYMSPLSNLEIALHSLIAIQSQMLAQQSSGKSLSKMIIVGTHRIKEQHCSESILGKSRKSSFKEHLIFHSAEGNSLIHNVGPDSATAPLMIRFPSNLVPTSLFWSLVSSHLSATISPLLCLKASPSDLILMEYVTSDYKKFALPSFIMKKDARCSSELRVGKHCLFVFVLTNAY